MSHTNSYKSQQTQQRKQPQTNQQQNNTPIKGAARFRIQREIADTLQGRIYYGTDLVTSKPCIIKESWKQLVHGGRSRKGHRVAEDFLNERKIIMLLSNDKEQHNGIAKGIDQWDDQHCYFYAMEYCNDELFDYILSHHKSNEYSNFISIESKKEQIPMKTPNKWIKNVTKIFKQICLTTQWMHSKGICHLDLSLENTMIDIKTLNIKIIDFGLAQVFENNNFTYSGRIGKLQYMCPEAYSKKTYDAQLADVYTLGVILFMMLIGAPPYSAPKKQNPAFNYCINGRIRDVLKHWKRLRLVTEDALDLLNKIIKYENKRISLQEILNHAFITSMDGKNNQITKPVSNIEDITADLSSMSLDDDNDVDNKQTIGKNIKIIQFFGVDPMLLNGTLIPDKYSVAIPDILIKMKKELFEKNGHLIVGIFRIAPDTDECKRFENEINNGGYPDIDCISISYLMKKWYKDLPTSILHNVSLEDMEKCQKSKDMNHVNEVINNKVDEPEQSYYKWLLDLCIDITKHEDINKMSLRNMAVVWSSHLCAWKCNDPLVVMKMASGAVTFFELSIKWRMAQSNTNISKQSYDNDDNTPLNNNDSVVIDDNDDDDDDGVNMDIVHLGSSDEPDDDVKTNNGSMYCELLLSNWGLLKYQSLMQSNGWGNPNDWNQLTVPVLVYEIGFPQIDAQQFMVQYNNYSKYQDEFNKKQPSTVEKEDRLKVQTQQQTAGVNVNDDASIVEEPIYIVDNNTGLNITSKSIKSFMTAIDDDKDNGASVTDDFDDPDGDNDDDYDKKYDIVFPNNFKSNLVVQDMLIDNSSYNDNNYVMINNKNTGNGNDQQNITITVDNTDTDTDTDTDNDIDNDSDNMDYNTDQQQQQQHQQNTLPNHAGNNDNSQLSSFTSYTSDDSSEESDQDDNIQSKNIIDDINEVNEDPPQMIYDSSSEETDPTTEGFVIESNWNSNDEWVTNDDENFSIITKSFINHYDHNKDVRVKFYFVKYNNKNNTIENKKYVIIKCPQTGGNGSTSNSNSGGYQNNNKQPNNNNNNDNNNNNNNSYNGSASGSGNGNGNGNGGGKDNNNNNNNNNKPISTKKKDNKKKKKKKKQSSDDDEMATYNVVSLEIPDEIDNKLKTNNSSLVFMENNTGTQLTFRYNKINGHYEVDKIIKSKKYTNKSMKKLNNDHDANNVVDHDFIATNKDIKQVLNCYNKYTGKHKKLKKNKYIQKHGYEPNAKYRARGNIEISRHLTNNIIPSMIKENISNLYDYMDKTTALQLSDKNGKNIFKNGRLKIINFDFHCKNTNKILYGLVIKTNGSKSYYKWQMIDTLYTADQIKKEYGIVDVLLPKSSRLNQINYENQVKNLLRDNKERNKIFSQTKWPKIYVFNKDATKRRYTLSLNKEEFIKSCKNSVANYNNNNNDDIKDDKDDDIRVIPAMMFNNITNMNWIEYIWIVRIDPSQTVDIGISFKYNNNNNTIIATALHFVKDHIKQQHQLAVPNHDCKCLDDFSTNIFNHLSIGNPDDQQNKYNTKCKEVDKLKAALLQQKKQKYDAKINLNPKNNTKQELLRLWLKSINLEQYISNLINEGYDDIESLRNLEMNELDLMGIKKNGHKKKLMQNIKTMPFNNNNNASSNIQYQQASMINNYQYPNYHPPSMINNYNIPSTGSPILPLQYTYGFVQPALTNINVPSYPLNHGNYLPHQQQQPNNNVGLNNNQKVILQGTGSRNSVPNH